MRENRIAADAKFSNYVQTGKFFCAPGRHRNRMLIDGLLCAASASALFRFLLDPVRKIS